MQIIEAFKEKISNAKMVIGIGLGSSNEVNSKIMATINRIKIPNRAKISFFGNPEVALLFENEVKNITFSDNPAKSMIESLISESLDAVIRGAISATKFLDQVKNQFKLKKIRRLALLETANGHQFFFGPVGIDECNSVEDKITFIESALKIFDVLKIKPKISILSGGRTGDKGRDPDVDKTLNDAEQILNYFKKQKNQLEINYDEILIENAIKKESNLILGPNGFSGNLIYRTLVHLGSGRAYGAIYLDLDRIVIDTSRVGNETEIEGGLILSMGLLKAK
jgi:putative methanogen marker protein 4